MAGKEYKISKVSYQSCHAVTKQQYAVTDGKPNILIDDYMKNIKEWENKGGIGVHHTDPRKTISELKRLGFK